MNQVPIIVLTVTGAMGDLQQLLTFEASQEVEAKTIFVDYVRASVNVTPEQLTPLLQNAVLQGVYKLNGGGEIRLQSLAYPSIQPFVVEVTGAVTILAVNRVAAEDEVSKQLHHPDSINWTSSLRVKN